MNDFVYASERQPDKDGRYQVMNDYEDLFFADYRNGEWKCDDEVVQWREVRVDATAYVKGVAAERKNQESVMRSDKNGMDIKSVTPDKPLSEQMLPLFVALSRKYPK